MLLLLFILPLLMLMFVKAHAVHAGARHEVFDGTLRVITNQLIGLAV